MSYRQIHTKIWKDAWFLELPPEGKLLFLYLCTNERTNILGLYDLPLKVIGFETDLSPESIKEQLAAFQRDGKVEYEAGWVWVKNLMRYNAQNLRSTDVQNHIRKTLASLPDGRLKDACAAYNTIPTPTQDHPPTIPPPDVQEQKQEQDQEPKQEQSTGQEQEQTSAGAFALMPAPAGLSSASLLAAYGIAEPALTKYSTSPPDWIAAWIREVDDREGVRDRRRLLVHCLDAGGWPKSRASPDNGDSDRRRFISGEYAEYIKH